jgi:hypothetical protein
VSRFAIALLGSTVLTMVGCASVPPPKQVDVSQQCFTDIRQLPATSLGYLSEEAAKKIKPRDYSEFARCLQTADGTKLPAALFRLDQVTPPSSVKVSLTSSKYGVLAAAVTLLDADYKEISRTGFDAFINRGAVYSADVFINRADVRYISVSPDMSQVGKSEKQYTSNESPVVIPAGPVFFVYRAGSESIQSRAFANAGSLLVAVKPATSIPIPARK